MFCGKCRTENPDDNTFCIKCGAEFSLMRTPTFESTPPSQEEDKSFGNQFLGKVFANCKIEKKLGEGGMGAVFLGLHTSLEQHRAIKILPRGLASNQVYIQRFFKEAKSAAAMEHPNIVHVYDAGEQDGFYYLIMQFVKGMSIADQMRAKGPIPWQGALRLVKQVLSAFIEAHGQNIIHRDIKPDNILLDEAGVAKVADFGLAKNVAEVGGLTRTGQIMGTPHYMSPEQCQGDPTDQRTDIYALGATFYTMLTGKPMFTAETPMAVLHKQIYVEPEPIDKLVPDLPHPLASIIHKMLAKDKEVRFNSAEEVTKALEIFELHISSVNPITPTIPLDGKSSEAVEGAVKDPTPFLPTTPLTVKKDEITPKKEEPATAEKKKASPVLLITITAVAVIGLAVGGFVAFTGNGQTAARTGKTGTMGVTGTINKTVPHKTVAPDVKPILNKLDELIADLQKALASLNLNKAEEIMAQVKAETSEFDNPEVNEKFKEAESVFNDLKKKHTNFNKLFAEAAEARKRGDFKEEKEKLLQAGKLKSKKDEQLETMLRQVSYAESLNKGKSYLKDKKWDEARVEFNRASEHATAEQMPEIKSLIAQADKEELNEAKSEVQQLVEARSWSEARRQLDAVNKKWPEEKLFTQLAKRVSLEEIMDVPMATFMMGTSDGASREKPVHKVSLRAYEIDKFEVTNLQFKEFMDAGGYKNQDYWSYEGWQWRDINKIEKPKYFNDLKFNKPYQPVVGISWYEVAAYAKWAGKRLPTEAEWEYAAKGKDKNNFWPWGKKFSASMCNSRESGKCCTTEVILFDNGKSHSGCCNMAGNVWEWCSDWFDEEYYKKSKTSNPKGPRSGSRKVIRGGSWFDLQNNLKTTKRQSFDPTARRDNIGFRCAKSR